MNGYQICVVLFGLMVTALSISSIIVVVRSPCFTFKPLWVIGCLFGFVGLGINWTTPDDIILLFGMQIPVIMIIKLLMNGQVLVKVMFPVVSLVALTKSGADLPSQASPKKAGEG